MTIGRVTAVVVAIFVLVGCTVPAPEPSASVSGEQHRIGVRTTADGPEFYDVETDDRFVPRGPNLHRFGREGAAVVDELFAVDTFDIAWVDEQLEQIADHGYNSVRTSVDLCRLECLGSAGGGIDGEFLDNIVAFLHRAKAHRVQVFLTSNDLPARGGFVPRVEATADAQFDGYLNSHYFHPTGFAVYRDYWVAIVSGLIDRGAPLDAIAGYQIRGELFQFGDTPPLSLREGRVTTANGVEYDLADPAAREALVADGTRFWLDGVRQAIREVDPTALVGVGVFAPNTPNSWLPQDDPRVIAMDAIWESELDFVDVHLYPGYIGLAALAENLRMAGGDQVKPTLFGEFGAFTFVFPDAGSAASGLMAWQTAACAYGMDGWFHWHWTGVDDHEVWTGTEDDGVINTVLSPRERPDPCVSRSFDFLEVNLAWLAATTASSSAPGHPPSLAVDGLESTSWQSGGEAPAWLEVDLDAPSVVREVRLVVDQFPAGPTVHRVLARRDGSWQQVHVFTGETAIGDALSWRPDSPLGGVDAIRVETTASPSFVSWFEVAVLG